MLRTEYIRNLNSNYVRVPLDKKPEEQRYQYCILSRGGIKGLLPCSLRYINNKAFLYYDITSTQNVFQIFSARQIPRIWVRDLFWSMKHLNRELERFLLDGINVIWRPEQIFQDVEKNYFYFMFVPYCEEKTDFLDVLKFLVEHIDYNDETLVECVYKMYERSEELGADYLKGQIYEDAQCLEEKYTDRDNPAVKGRGIDQTPAVTAFSGLAELSGTETGRQQSKGARAEENVQPAEDREKLSRPVNEKKSIRYLFEGRKKKQKQNTDQYRQQMLEQMEGYKVSEDTVYQDDFGRTIYVEEKEETEPVRRLLTREGTLAAEITKPLFVIGKKVEGVDLILEDGSVSRLHARILQEGGALYLEDLNSTNGTFKNGLRMQPYEKRPLEAGDEIKLGRVIFIYR